jgi:DNA-binding transcriptional LysR family regulator
MDELRALRLFHKVADTGSLRQAAVSEGLTPQAVSKSIAQLEQHLGIRLLSRTTRRCSLTQEGAQLREQTLAPIEDLANALRRARSATERVSGTLRLSAAPAARKVLAAPLAAFCNLHPDVTIEFLAANTFSDLVLDQVDVGFRAGRSPQGEVVARRLFTVQQVVCAAPAYLARYGTPASLEELRRHRCTGFRHHASGRVLSWELEDEGRPITVDVAPFFCTNDPEVELEIVRSGTALGLIDLINAAQDLRAGQLVALWPHLASNSLGFHIYYPSGKRLPRRTRSFIDFITQALLNDRRFTLDRPG